MRKGMLAGVAALAMMVAVAPVGAEPPAPALSEQQTAFIKGLHPQTGDVAVPGAGATLHLGTKYYFLGADDAKRVLTEAWGNPPGEVSDVLGLVMPAGSNVFDNIWGAVITFKDSGYVTDDDANSADYDKILTDMRSGEADNNAERVKAGYKAMHLVGWAQPPSYDKANHSLIWARDLKIDGSPVDTLNYDVRVLGRKGVLSMNMLWDMGHLDAVHSAAQEFGKTATFATGQTYADYNSSTDKSAGYGLAGLVAGGVAIVAAKKLGLLAILLPFLKKGFILLLVAFAAAWRWVKRLFGRGGDGDEPNAGIS
jgi:uncharacterized membrane-anchored protein